MNKIFLIVSILFGILCARDSVLVVESQVGYFGHLKRAGSSANLLFDYDNSYSDDSLIMLDDSGFHAFRYKITADADEVVMLNYDTTITLSNGMDEIKIRDIEADTGDEFTMPSSGEKIIRLRGKVVLPSDVSLGDYNANFDFSADYKNP